MIDVNRGTLYEWQKKIPNFWSMVRERRMIIGSQARTNAVWKGVYLRAAKGDAEQAKLFLGVYDGWQPPSQKHDIKVSASWADLVRAKAEVIDAEVVDNGANTNVG
jgi:hypothetical protein